VTAQDTAGYVELNLRPLGGHARLLELVGSGKRVLDVGCSSGYLARPLVERGCVVIGVERDPAAAEVARAVCEDVLVGDVETMELPFEDGSFDVALCGDLVEHLRDPELFLARARARVAENRAIVADVIENNPRLDWIPPTTGVVQDHPTANIGLGTRVSFHVVDLGGEAAAGMLE